MSHRLTKFLSKLEHTGLTGFEGLTAALLENLTGQHFRLAAAGTQEGRDMSSRRGNANVIAVECKHYLKEQVDEREILGEITQATRSIDDLDIWALVISRDVPSQRKESFRQAAKEKGIEFVVIPEGDGGPSSLEVLCSQAPNVVLGFLKPKLTPQEQQDLRGVLEGIKCDPSYSENLEKLRQEFLHPLIGYNNWQANQKHWLRTCFQTPQDSRADLSQILNVADEGAKLIVRYQAWEQIDNWYNTWKTTNKAFVLVGEEGDGKTWAIASWINKKITEDERFPFVIFLSSPMVGSNDPLDLIVKEVAKRSPSSDLEYVRKRVERWITKRESDNPLFLLVLDDINERNSIEWWRELIQKLQGTKWMNKVALVITCRNQYWSRYFGQLSYLKPTVHILGPLNDNEFESALRLHNLENSNVPQELRPLVMKPRYFDLWVRFRSEIEKSGDFTKARLFYEDWKDRFNRKTGIILDATGFESRLQDLAKRYREGMNAVQENHLKALFPWDDERTINELSTGGVLKERRGATLFYEVQDDFLKVGLGLLLVAEVEEALERGEVLTERIARWMEPEKGIDFKSEVYEHAALRALRMEGVHSETRIALLFAWMQSQNAGEKVESHLPAYFGDDPQSYFGLAEAIWSEPGDQSWAEKVLMRIFLKQLKAEEQVRRNDSIWINIAERWLGFIHVNGYPSQRRRGSFSEPSQRSGALQEPENKNLVVSLSSGGYKLTTIESDGLLRLGRVALALISHVNRIPFIRGLGIGCIADAIMGSSSKFNGIAWIIRTSPLQIWEEFQSEINQLLSLKLPITQNTASRLLSFCGTTQAIQVIQGIVTESMQRFNLERADKHYLGRLIPVWSPPKLEELFSDKDIHPAWIARRLNEYCIDPEYSFPDDFREKLSPLINLVDIKKMKMYLAPTSDDIEFKSFESLFCAFAPDDIANLVCQLVAQVTERNGLSLKLLCFTLTENNLIFTDEVKACIFKAWQTIQSSSESIEKDERLAEIFLFSEVIKQFEAEAQLNFLLNRPVIPDMGIDLLLYEQYFKPTHNWEGIWGTINSTSNLDSLRRLLWFISAHPEKIPPTDIEEHLLPLLSRPRSKIRSTILEIIFKSRFLPAIQKVLEGNWHWNVTISEEEHFLHSNTENYWGSKLLCEYGQGLSFEAILDRIHPIYIGHAVSERGNKPEEIKQFAELIDQQWDCLRDNQSDDLPGFPPIYIDAEVSRATGPLYFTIKSSDQDNSRSIMFVASESVWGGIDDSLSDGVMGWMNEDIEVVWERERKLIEQIIIKQRQLRNYWFAHYFTDDTLDKILEVCPDKVDKWFNEALTESKEGKKRIISCSTFYEALCKMLLKMDPERGIKLFWHIAREPMSVVTQDSDTEISLLAFAVFQADQLEIVKKCWEQIVDNCLNDSDLLELTIAAQFGNGKDWLFEFIQQNLDSKLQLAQMKAITLLGLTDHPEFSESSFTTLIERLPNTWIRELAEISFLSWKKNSWAKHWFKKFLIEDRQVKAWAAFRLFLKCVDRRFWLWREQYVAEFSNETFKESRIHFYLDNLDTIKKSAKENEKELREHLYGHKVMSKQVWPWMNEYIQ